MKSARIILLFFAIIGLGIGAIGLVFALTAKAFTFSHTDFGTGYAWLIASPALLIGFAVGIPAFLLYLAGRRVKPMEASNK